MTGDDARHIGRSLRMRVGEMLELCDGQGHAVRGELVHMEAERVTVGKLCPLEESTEPFVAVTVFQGLPKGEKMEAVVQKCTELGAVRIVPVCMKRCIVTPEGGAKKTERLKRIALEAAKQSGRCLVPEVEAPISFEEALRRLKEATSAFVCSEYERELSLKNWVAQQKTAHETAFLVGPEGGLDETELARLREEGLTEITLGRRILRTETAAPAVTAVLVYEWGDR